MLPCKEIAKMLSSDENLNLRQRAEIKMHLFVCKHCSAYAKHLKLMKQGMKRLFSSLTKVNPDEIRKLEERIIAKLKK